MLARVARLAAYARDAQLKAARRQALTRVTAQAAGGVATAGVYTALGILLAVGALPLAVAGTAVLAIRSAQASLNTLLYAVNQCYEEGLYFSDYLAFCADAARRIPAAGRQGRPGGLRPDHRGRRHLHLSRRQPAGAARGQHRDRPRRGRRPGGRERLGQDHAREDPGRPVPARQRHGVLGPDGRRRCRPRAAAGADRRHRPGPRQLAADRTPQHRHGPRRGSGRAGPGGGGLRGGHGDREAPARLRHPARPPLQGRGRTFRRPVAADRGRTRASTGRRDC